MKLRYLFSAILASALLFVGCVEESVDSLDNIKVDKTYITIPAEGGECTLTFEASEDWNLVVTDNWPNVIKYEKDESTGKDKVDADGNKVIESSTPSWLAIKDESKMSGKAGKQSIVFTAVKTESGREIELEIRVGKSAQFFRIRQGSMLASVATVKDVMAGPDGKTFRVKGVCTNITGTYYGNWYLKDDSTDEEIYVYGTVDADGKYNWESFDIEVGDVVEIEGPKTTYNGVVEIVDASVIEVTKSLIKIIVPEEEVETGKVVDQAGATFKVQIAYKGSGVFYTIPEECKSWVSVDDMTFTAGVPSKLEANPADTATVTITALVNEGPSRKGLIDFSSSTAKAASVVTYQFAQTGLAPISDVRELTAGDPAMIAGTVVAVHANGFIVSDETASLYVYDKNIKPSVGNNVVIAGTFDNYYGTLQIKNVTLKSNDESEEEPVTPPVVNYTMPQDYAQLPKCSADAPTTYPYVKVQGVLNYSEKAGYSVVVEGSDAKTLLYKTENDYKALVDKTVTVEGYLMGWNNKYSEYQLIERSVKEASGETVTLTKISDVLPGDAEYVVDGTVVAAGSKAYVIADETGNLLVYGSNHGRKVLERVRLTGTASRHQGYDTNSIQLSAKAVEIFPAVSSYDYKPEVLDAAGLDAKVGKEAVCSEVQFEGKLLYSKYVNIEVGGEYQGSLYYVDTALYEKYKDQTVIVKGYITGTYKYLNVLPYSVEVKK